MPVQRVRKKSCFFFFFFFLSLITIILLIMNLHRVLKLGEDQVIIEKVKYHLHCL